MSDPYPTNPKPTDPTPPYRTPQRQAEALTLAATFTVLFLAAIRAIDAWVLALMATSALLAIIAGIGWWMFSKIVGANVSPMWHGLLGVATAAVVVAP